jgi:hypothetical protein
MCGDRDMPDASPIVGEEHQDEHEAVGHGRDHEEIGRHDLADVIPQEGASSTLGNPTAENGAVGRNDTFESRRRAFAKCALRAVSSLRCGGMFRRSRGE